MEKYKISAEDEDIIFPRRIIIQEFFKTANEKFDELASDLGYKGELEEFLFDYCCNSGENIEFSEYLEKFNRAEYE